MLLSTHLCARGLAFQREAAQQPDQGTTESNLEGRGKELLDARCAHCQAIARTGESAQKALALGANAVLLGRAILYGLAAAGEAGVDHVLRLLKDEVDRTLAQIGCARAAGAGPHDQMAKVAKIAKPTVETSVKVRLNLEKFVWSSREK
jgi:hypothetical protein